MLNNAQRLICYKTKQNQTKPNQRFFFYGRLPGYAISKTLGGCFCLSLSPFVVSIWKHFINLSHFITVISAKALLLIVNLASLRKSWLLQGLICFNSYIWLCVNNYINRLIALEGRVFVNGLGDRCSIPGYIISKTLKMILDTSLLNTQQYNVRMKGKVEQSWGRSSALPYT